MAVYRANLRIGVQDPNASYKFSYAYFVNAGTLGDAANAAQQIWQQLRQGHSSDAYCYEVYVSDLVENTTNYVIMPIGAGVASGMLPVIDNALPTFNVVRVELNVIGGRPSRKYHRLPLAESNIGNGLLNTTTLAAISDAHNAVLNNVPEVCDESGNGFNGVVIKGITSRRLGKWAYTNVPPKPIPSPGP